MVNNNGSTCKFKTNIIMLPIHLVLYILRLRLLFHAQGTILDLVLEEMYNQEDAEGFFVAGFPRDIIQAQNFEERTGVRPPCVLIDCSELELGTISS